jgi:rhodanese-related sulfurtransferase
MVMRFWPQLPRREMDSDISDLRIEVRQALTKLEAGEAIVLDVVQPGAWEQLDSVIRGSVRIAPDEIVARFRELSADLDIIAYCT